MRIKNWPIWILGFWFVAGLVATLNDLNSNQIHLDLILAKPSFQYVLGLDDLGRDILPRLMAGARVSFLVIFLVTIVTASIGIMLGLVSGYYGGWIDRTLMQITDVFLAFPGILLAIAFAAVLGAGLSNLILALCITSWVGYARLTRGQVLSLRQRQHVVAAQSLGASTPRIMFKHILPLIGRAFVG
jgi:peptide/nickel transport system permease protein